MADQQSGENFVQVSWTPPPPASTPPPLPPLPATAPPPPPSPSLSPSSVINDEFLNEFLVLQARATGTAAQKKRLRVLSKAEQLEKACQDFAKVEEKMRRLMEAAATPPKKWGRKPKVQKQQQQQAANEQQQQALIIVPPKYIEQQDATVQNLLQSMQEENQRYEARWYANEHKCAERKYLADQMLQIDEGAEEQKRQQIREKNAEREREKQRVVRINTAVEQGVRRSQQPPPLPPPAPAAPADNETRSSIDDELLKSRLDVKRVTFIEGEKELGRNPRI